MINFKVDEKKCINCGMCIAECPVFIINNKTKFPTIKIGKEKNCLKCQHCLAVCPQGAISIWNKNPDDSISTSNKIPDFFEMENLIKTRRSIRRFTDEEIDKNLIHSLISTASFAPTAKNENAVQFTVIDNKKDFTKFRKRVYDSIKEAFYKKNIPESKIYFSNFQKMWEEKHIDILFRNAPHLLITSAPKMNTEPETDSCIAMSYFELLANSKGIGTLWDGFAKSAFDEIVPELKLEFGIPENQVISAILLFGKPAVKFARSIQNDNPKIVKITL